MAEGEWFYTVSGQQTGPVALQTLQVMASTGQLGRGEYVWTEGMAAWLPAGTVASIYGKSATAAPRPAPVAAIAAQSLNYGGYQQPTAPYGSVSYAAEARSALMFSILGFFCLGFIFGGIAVSKATKAKQGMASSGNFAGAGMATAATIIGWIDIVLHGLGLILRIVALSGRS